MININETTPLLEVTNKKKDYLSPILEFLGYLFLFLASGLSSNNVNGNLIAILNIVGSSIIFYYSIISEKCMIAIIMILWFGVGLECLMLNQYNLN